MTFGFTPDEKSALLGNLLTPRLFVFEIGSMKICKINLLALLVIGCAASAFAQSKYSGIYELLGGKVLVAITKGGHLLSVSKGSGGISRELDPSKSTVNADGKVVGGSTSGGLSLTGTIGSDFKFKGTVKEGGDTSRVTGIRTLN